MANNLKMSIVLLALVISTLAINLSAIATDNSKVKPRPNSFLAQANSTNPWRAVTRGENCPQVCQSIIQIPKEQRGKYELDKVSGMLRLDRVLYSAMHYPTNYGFIPQTLCDDHDPLDILVISSLKMQPLCLVDAKVIGYIRMVDSGQEDDKIIAVAKNDMSVTNINDITQLPQNTLDQIINFFETYKKLQKKEVRVDGYGGRSEAYGIINAAIELYNATYGQMPSKEIKLEF